MLLYIYGLFFLFCLFLSKHKFVGEGEVGRRWGRGRFRTAGNDPGRSGILGLVIVAEVGGRISCSDSYGSHRIVKDYTGIVKDERIEVLWVVFGH